MNNSNSRLATWLVVGALAIALPSARALSRADPPAAQDTAHPQQRTDDQITQAIRQEIAKDEKMSAHAQAIDVTTKNGMVTLKGVVKSATEKAAIKKIAVDVAGANKVDDRLELTPVS